MRLDDKMALTDKGRAALAEAMKNLTPEEEAEFDSIMRQGIYHVIGEGEDITDEQKVRLDELAKKATGI